MAASAGVELPAFQPKPFPVAMGFAVSAGPVFSPTYWVEIAATWEYQRMLAIFHLVDDAAAPPVTVVDESHTFLIRAGFRLW